MGNGLSGKERMAQRVATLKSHHQDPRTIWMPEVMGEDGIGCFCCAETIHIEICEHLPSELEGIMTFDEYKQIAESFNELMRSTWVSPFCYIAILPLSMCAERGLHCYRVSQYHKLLEQLNTTWNPRNVSFLEGTWNESGIAVGNAMVVMSFKSMFIVKWNGPLQAQVEPQVVVAPMTTMAPKPYGQQQQQQQQEQQQYAPQGYPQQQQQQLQYAPPQGYPQQPQGYAPQHVPQGSPQHRPQQVPPPPHGYAIPSPTQVARV